MRQRYSFNFLYLNGFAGGRLVDAIDVAKNRRQLKMIDCFLIV